MQRNCVDLCNSSYCPYSCICNGTIPVALQDHLEIIKNGGIVLKNTTVPVIMSCGAEDDVNGWQPRYKCSHCGEYESCTIAPTISSNEVICQMWI